jgi:Fe-S-cluster containining protein
VSEHDSTDEPVLPAGVFSEWMTEITEALAGHGETDVPCGTCTACCTSSQFVHIGPEETDTLAHIPKPLLFPAPRLPRGHVLMGYDERGHCPMLVDDQCSIYDHRPKTCRTYDCRVFAAAEVAIDDADKALIARRTRRWRFEFPTDVDRAQQAAVKSAAVYLRDNGGELPEELRPHTSTQLAVLAVELNGAFSTGGPPDREGVRLALSRRLEERR